MKKLKIEFDEKNSENAKFHRLKLYSDFFREFAAINLSTKR